MSCHTIYFDNAREAQELAGDYPEIISECEKIFRVELIARDTWLRIKGKDENISDLVLFFDQIRSARNKGAPLRQPELLYALQAFIGNKERSAAPLYDKPIEVSRKKTPVFPRTFGQKGYIEAMQNKDLTFGLGPAGTGKTYLAMATAVAALLKGKVSRMILTRPAIEAGETLGFLPGDIHEKIYPYLRPLYDALHDMLTPDDLEKYTDQNIIEVAPLAYMRGRTLNHAFVILDEAQNTTPEQMLMFLTRLGVDSKCVITGDLTQIDLPNKNSGLPEAVSTLKQIKDIAFVHLTDSDIVRHELVQKIIHAYRSKQPWPEKDEKNLYPRSKKTGSIFPLESSSTALDSHAAL
ncbi:MAG: AAA family ATPase [Kiritimatiellae bacterium]|nr:AAA family ATPase [Kiritimatiellia bacterium]